MQPQYADDPGGGGGGFSIAPMTRCVKRLILINVAVFIAQLLAGALGAGETFVDVFALNPSSWNSFLLPVWQLVSYGFLHSPVELSHIFWNMLMLYMFGSWLESVIGGRRFLVFYLIAMVIGGGAQLAVSVIMNSVVGAPGWGLPILGASGAVLGVTIAMATLEPTRRVYLVLIPLTMKTMAILVVGKDVVGFLMDLGNSTGGIAHIVHMGGALTGYLAVRTGMIWRDPLEVVSKRIESHQVDQEQDVRKKLDLLLEKINREGIQSLSSGEKRFLKRASKR